MVAIDWPAYLPCDDFTHFCLEILESLEERQVRPELIRTIVTGHNMTRRMAMLPTYNTDRVAAAVIHLYREGNPRR